MRSVCVRFLLKTTGKHLEETKSPLAACNSAHVDDIVIPTDSGEQIRTCKEMKKIFRRAGMNSAIPAELS